MQALGNVVRTLLTGSAYARKPWVSKPIDSLEEVLELCQLDETGTSDFGHLHALHQGIFQSSKTYISVLDAIEALGKERGKAFHTHFNRVEYTAAGEKTSYLKARILVGFDPLAEVIIIGYISCNNLNPG